MIENYLITYIIAQLALFIFLVVFIIRQKQIINRYKSKQQKVIHEYNSKIHQLRLEERKKTQTDISKEIHDNIGQLLGLAQMNMSLVLNDMLGSIRIHRITKDTIGYIEKVSSFLHDISHNLSNKPYLIKDNLVTNIVADLEKIQITTGIKTNLDILGIPQPIHDEKITNVYRILQEAFNNAVKYSNASKLNIVFNYHKDYFEVIVTDNGKGFELKNNKGMGIQTLHERAAGINAELNIKSEKNVGTAITLISQYS